MSERSEGGGQDLQEREQFANVFIFDGLIASSAVRVADQRHFARVRRDVCTHAGVIHAIEAYAALDIL